MCFVLYMASDRLRREIPWDEENPMFHVKTNDADAQKTRSHFIKRHIHYLGSDNGCGCGFKRAPEWVIDQTDLDETELTKLASCKDNQRRVHDYLLECLHDEEMIELFGCWSGDEELPTKKSRTVDVNALIAQDFWFEEREHITITMAKQQVQPIDGKTGPG
jgi:hypothetical protein